MNENEPELVEPELNDDNRFGVTEQGHKFEIKRNCIGCLCGYIHVPDEQVGKNLYRASVHGGITFDEKQEDGTRIVGFDCAHSFDGQPQWWPEPRWMRGEYRDVYYVMSQIRSLSRQVAGLGEEDPY